MAGFELGDVGVGHQDLLGGEAAAYAPESEHALLLRERAERFEPFFEDGGRRLVITLTLAAQMPPPSLEETLRRGAGGGIRGAAPVPSARRAFPA